MIILILILIILIIILITINIISIVLARRSRRPPAARPGRDTGVCEKSYCSYEEFTRLAETRLAQNSSIYM